MLALRRREPGTGLRRARKMMEMIIDGVADLMRQHIRFSLTVAAIDEQLSNTATAKR